MTKTDQLPGVWFIEENDDRSEIKVHCLSQPENDGIHNWLQLVTKINDMLDDGYVLHDSDERYIGNFGSLGDHIIAAPSVDTGRLEIVAVEPTSTDADGYEVIMTIKKEEK